MNSDLASLADRLNWLFEVVHTDAQEPITSLEVATRVNAQSADIDAIRQGERTEVPEHELVTIAEFFGAPPTYFLEDDELESVQMGLLWVALRRGGIEQVRLCRTGPLDARQMRDLGLILLDCLRSPQEIG